MSASRYNAKTLTLTAGVPQRLLFCGSFVVLAASLDVNAIQISLKDGQPTTFPPGLVIEMEREEDVIIASTVTQTVTVASLNGPVKIRDTRINPGLAPIAVTSVDLGTRADAAAGTDTGTASLISLFKRSLTKMPTLDGFGAVPVTLNPASVTSVLQARSSYDVITSNNVVAPGVTVWTPASQPTDKLLPFINFYLSIPAYTIVGGNLVVELQVAADGSGGGWYPIFRTSRITSVGAFSANLPLFIGFAAQWRLVAVNSGSSGSVTIDFSAWANEGTSRRAAQIAPPGNSALYTAGVGSLALICAFKPRRVSLIIDSGAATTPGTARLRAFNSYAAVPRRITLGTIATVANDAVALTFDDSNAAVAMCDSVELDFSVAGVAQTLNAITLGASE